MAAIALNALEQVLAKSITDVLARLTVRLESLRFVKRVCRRIVGKDGVLDTIIGSDFWIGHR